jgi:hypothetical protein
MKKHSPSYGQNIQLVHSSPSQSLCNLNQNNSSSLLFSPMVPKLPKHILPTFGALICVVKNGVLFWLSYHWNRCLKFSNLISSSEETFFSPKDHLTESLQKCESEKIMELAINWTMALNLQTLNLYLYKATHMNPQPCPSIFLGQRETDLLAEGKKRKHKPQNHSMHFNIEIIETSRERSWWQNFYHTDGQLAPWVYLAKHFDHETFVAWMASCYIEPPASC